MLRSIFIFILVTCACAAPAQEQLFKNMFRQSDLVVRATVVEQGRRVRMEDGVTFCNIRCVVNEVFKGAKKTNDTLNLEVTQFGNISLGGKFRDATADTTEFYANGTELVFFLRPQYNDGDGPETWVPVDALLGAQMVSEHLLWFLRGYDPHEK